METIPNFPTYCATKDGRIWSRKTKRFLKPNLSDRYPFVILYKNLERHRRRVHRLVLKTFIGSCPKGMEACHNNGIRTDNRLKNLRWDTRKNNIRDEIKHGTHYSPYQNGEAHFMAKLTEKNVRMIIYMHRTGLFLQKEFVKIYNVHNATISSIVNKKAWKHIWSDFKVKLI